MARLILASHCTVNCHINFLPRQTFIAITEKVKLLFFLSKKVLAKAANKENFRAEFSLFT